MPAALQDLAYDQTRELIESRKLLPGKLYSESGLSKQLGISRTPIRRALQKIEQEGLVEILPQRGFYVYQFTDKDIYEIFQLRKLLEGFAIDCICSTGESLNLDAIRSNIKSQEEAQRADDFDKFILVNKKFHQEIVELTGNERLYKMYDNLRMSVDAVGRQILKKRGHWQQSVDEHKLILEALENRDYNKAKKALYSHFDSSERVLRQGLKRTEN